jgi:hypothetical protein
MTASASAPLIIVSMQAAQEAHNKALKDEAEQMRKLTDEKAKIEGLVRTAAAKLDAAKHELLAVLTKEQRALADLKEIKTNGETLLASSAGAESRRRVALPVKAHERCVKAVADLKTEKVGAVALWPLCTWLR